MGIAEKVTRPARALFLALVAASGCTGGDSRPTSAPVPVPDVRDAGSTPGSDDDDREPAPVTPLPSLDAGLGEETTAAGEVNRGAGADCPVRTIDIYGLAPDVLIVFDRSLSMSLNRRWEPSKQAVETITRDFGSLLRFGISVFPGSAGDCAQGQLDVPLAIDNGSAIAELVEQTQTGGLTPTGPALTQALHILGDRSPTPDGERRAGYVLLVTDGEPNCQALPLFPDTSQQEAARAAVRALKEKNIPTYVVGYQIDASYQSTMNELAQLGGTSRYRPVESADEIVTTFREITQDVVKCSFDLSDVTDPRFVRVQIDGTSSAFDASDGWTIQGRTVTLQGTSCAKLRDGRGHMVNAQVECSEVVLD
jgi:Mg-chelatase subunit ChlD